MSSQGKFANSKSEISLKLSQGAIAITANQRLSIHLQREYAQYQIQQKKRTWRSAKIGPLSIWLQQLYQTLTDAHLVLSDTQERYLWQNIIEEDSVFTKNTSAGNSAQLVKQAWQLCQHWEVPFSSLANTHIKEVDAFYRWAHIFTEKCEQRQWISAAQIPTQLQKQITKQKITISDEIFLIGFDELSPIMESLFHELSKTVTVTPIKSNCSTQSISTLALADQQSEIECMARWAKTQLDSNRTAKIGCIVPNLNECHADIQAIFTEIFTPENLMPGLSQHTLPFNISAANSLSHFSMIQVALSALELKPISLPLSTLSSVFLSSYFTKHTNDLDAGAMLDAACRKNNALTISLPTIFQHIHTAQTHYPQHSWLNRLRDWQQYQVELPTLAKLSEWITHFIKILEKLGWPGIFTLSSHEYQLQQRWYNELENCSTLDLVSEKVSYSTALSTLNQYIQNTSFHTEGSDMPIQILGVLESGGMEFDSIWVMGLHQEIWPSPAKPNPFLPHPLQRQQQMPHADTHREWAYTQHIMDRFKRSADSIIFSYPRTAGDKVLSPSPFIIEYPIISENDLNLVPPFSLLKHLHQSIPLECIQDEKAPAIQTQECIQGGSWILKQQALCPFRAFAHVRLQSYALGKAQLGIHAVDRGILVHEVLAHIWSHLKDHASLCALDENTLDELIINTLSIILSKSEQQQNNSLNLALLQLEQVRLHKLIKAWLYLEKTRPPFRVHAHESRQEIYLHELALQIQIDRIDELEDGSYFIIDYKTGLTQIQHWFSDPLIEPQLPLYCVYGEKQFGSKPVVGIAFAEIRSNKMHIKGVISEKHVSLMADKQQQIVKQLIPITQLKQNWKQSIERWQQQLLKLSHEFIQGDARVAPTTAEACRYCDLQSVCRIQMENKSC